MLTTTKFRARNSVSDTKITNVPIPVGMYTLLLICTSHSLMTTSLSIRGNVLAEPSIRTIASLWCDDQLWCRLHGRNWASVVRVARIPF